MQTQDASTFFAVVAMRVIKQNIFDFLILLQVILDDQPPPIVPRKHSAAEKSMAMALPNTYVKMEDSMKKGEALSADCFTQGTPMLVVLKG